MRNKVTLGYDLNNKYGQISYFDYDNEEPKTVEAAAINCQIPLALAFFNDRWVYGKEAKRLNIINAGVAFVDFFDKAVRREKITVEDKTYDAVWLLAKFIELTLQDFEEIDFITFTVPKTDVDMSTMLKGIALHMSIPKDHVAIQDHKESFCHYMYDQPKELWQYEAALFNCEDDRVEAYMLRKLNTGRGNNDLYVTVDEVANATVDELSAIFPVFEANKAKDADEKFKVFIQGVFDKKVISSVFLTGEGFEQEWYPQSLKVLCNGRRTFLGNNLYSKGACYYSRKVDSGQGVKPIYLDETRLIKRVSVLLRVEGKEVWYPIVNWGSHWYESDSRLEVLINDLDEIKIRIESLTDNKNVEKSISLDGLTMRDDYSIRATIEVMFLNERSCKIIVKDIGFGDFFPSTGFQAEELIDLGGIHGQFNSMS